jgi:WD40 repeat protein
MNTRPPIESPNTTVVLSVAFNDDCSCFSVGLNTGYYIFNAAQCTLKCVREFNGGIGLVQMLGKSNFVALVGGGKHPKFAQNKVILWDDAKARQSLEITAFTSVRNVQLAKNRIVVVLQNSVRVYAFAKPVNLIAAYETADNLLGLCSMTEKTIAFPGRTTGQVQLVDIATGNVSIIPAHSSALRAIKFSPDGELLATASEQVGLDGITRAVQSCVLSVTTGHPHPCLCNKQLRPHSRAPARDRPSHHFLTCLQPIGHPPGEHVGQINPAHL